MESGRIKSVRHTDSVYSLDVSPDHTLVVIGSRDGIAYGWLMMRLSNNTKRVCLTDQMIRAEVPSPRASGAVARRLIGGGGVGGV